MERFAENNGHLQDHLENPGDSLRKNDMIHFGLDWVST